MSNKKKKTEFKNVVEVEEEQLGALFTDTIDVSNNINRNKGFGGKEYATQAEVIEALSKADTSGIADVVASSRKLYATNPIYAKLIDYFANTFIPRYYVTPRLMPDGKKLTGDAYKELLNDMMEKVDGLALEVKIPQILTSLWKEGGVYMTLFYSVDRDAIETLFLPAEYCRRIGQTEFGTDVIKFNFQYFDSLGLSVEQIEEIFDSFPPEFKDSYLGFKKDKEKWRVLDPRFSSCILLNEKGIPTQFYAYGAILNHQVYQQNELDRSSQQLQTIIEHHIPTYQDKLLLTNVEMNALHKRFSNIVKSTKNARLVTTIGEVRVHPVLQPSSVANETLKESYKSIFDNGALNNAMFYGDSQYSIASSKSIDKGIVWRHIEKILNFYNFAINNLEEIDFKGYQADIAMVRVSRDTSSEDIAVYRENAKVGVGIVPFIVASGIKQRNIDSYLDMESELGLVDRLIPLRSSNTMASSYGDGAVEGTKSTNVEDDENEND